MWSHNVETGQCSYFLKLQLSESGFTPTPGGSKPPQPHAPLTRPSERAKTAAPPAPEAWAALLPESAPAGVGRAVLDRSPREPRQEETRLNISQYKCLLRSKKNGTLTKPQQTRAPRSRRQGRIADTGSQTPRPPRRSRPGSEGGACAQPASGGTGCSRQTRSNSSQDIFVANSTPCYASSAAITSIKTCLYFHLSLCYCLGFFSYGKIFCNALKSD